MHAATLEEATKWQNSTGYGLTGGLHALDPDEIDWWIDHVEVGNAYVNRGITGAIVQRQSFGGWKASALGSGAKAGGPNYVAQQGTWSEGDVDELPRAGLSATLLSGSAGSKASWTTRSHRPICIGCVALPSLTPTPGAPNSAWSTTTPR